MISHDDEKNAYICLSSAIVEQAAKDYLKTRKKLEYSKSGVSPSDIPSIKSAVLFFKSTWFEELTDIDPLRLLSMLDDKCRKDNKKKKAVNEVVREDFRIKLSGTYI